MFHSYRTLWVFSVCPNSSYSFIPWKLSHCMNIHNLFNVFTLTGQFGFFLFVLTQAHESCCTGYSGAFTQGRGEGCWVTGYLHTFSWWRVLNALQSSIDLYFSISRVEDSHSTPGLQYLILSDSVNLTSM